MENLDERLDVMARALVEVLAAHDPRVLADDALLVTVAATERLGRAVDALRISVAGEIGERSRIEHGTAGLAATRGCRNVRVSWSSE